MSDLISSDLPFTQEQRATLDAVLPMIIPASEDGTMPSAGEVDFLVWLAEYAPDSVVAIQATLNRIDAIARDSGDAFAAMQVANRSSVITSMFENEARTLSALGDQVMACYYSDENVLKALGASPGPPFPDGNTVEQSDLSLLDPVKERGKIWRDA